MFRIDDNQQGSLIDPFDYLGPKRKELLNSGWAGVFQPNIIDKLPVDAIQSNFNSQMGRPTKEIRTVLSVLILQQLFDLTDQETVRQFAFNTKLSCKTMSGRTKRSRDGPPVCL